MERYMRISLLASAVATLVASVALVGCGNDARPTAVATTPVASTAAATDYRRDANGVIEALAVGADGVAEVMAKPDPASAAWRNSLGTRLDALVQLDARARSLTPAAADAEVHQQLVEVTADFSRAAQLIRGGLEPLNVEGLDQAGQLLGNGVVKVAALRIRLVQ
jgi:hypothetical protein